MGLTSRFNTEKKIEKALSESEKKRQNILKLEEEVEMLISIAFNNQDGYNWIQRALKKHHDKDVDMDDIARAIESAGTKAVLELIED